MSRKDDASPGLDETMRDIGDGLLNLHESVRVVQDALLAARAHLYAALRECEQAGETVPGLADVKEALDQADREYFYVVAFLGDAIAGVTGGSSFDHLPKNAGELAALVDALGGPALAHCNHADRARASWAGKKARLPAQGGRPNYLRGAVDS